MFEVLSLLQNCFMYAGILTSDNQRAGSRADIHTLLELETSLTNNVYYLQECQTLQV